MPPETQDDTFVISSSTALGMGEYTLALLNIIIQNLPESELRRMRDALYHSVSLADDLLYNISISSTFDVLTINDVSALHSVNDTVGTSADFPTPGKFTTATSTKTTAPPPSPASTVDTDMLASGSTSLISTKATAHSSLAVAYSKSCAPRSVAVGYKRSTAPVYGVIVSARPRVGQPDYTNHPAFIEPGIPGSYSSPPVEPESNPSAYYVITKGLYVGIFCSWNECAPWVVKVAGSVHCKMRQWTEARDLYNARLTAGACEVLS